MNKYCIVACMLPILSLQASSRWTTSITSAQEPYIVPARVVALHEAAQCGDLHTIEELRREGVLLDEPDEFGANALHYATVGEQLETVQRFLAAGLAQKKDDHGVFPLLIAASAGHQPIIEALIAAGANVNDISDEGKSPLQMSALAGDFDTFHYLRKQGAILDLSARLKNGNSIVHLAAIGGNAPLLQHLIDQGANPNDQNNDLQTPLHAAVFNGHIEAFFCLVRANANQALRDRDGKPPLKYATSEFSKTLKEIKRQATTDDGSPSNKQ